MSAQNLQLKQISCLQSPASNPAWHEITHHYPFTLHCLTEGKPELEGHFSAAHAAVIHGEQAKSQGSIDEPIPWCTGPTDQQDREDSRQFQLKSFTYDCSYFSPFVGNLYCREQSGQGWYRWVGPNPSLEMRLPLAPAETGHWLFTVTFHAFLDETSSKNVGLKVNGRRHPLEWLKGLTYQSLIAEKGLTKNTMPNEPAIASLTLTVPEARLASERDQRVVAFAIRELSLTPA